MMKPLYLEFKSAGTDAPVKITTFSSYSFERSVITPASAFRFTAPDVDKARRMSIRSGDLVTIISEDANNVKTPICTGIVDETDYHGSGTVGEYVISGRDMVGQLVDNDSVDAQNKIVNYNDPVAIDFIVESVIKNTRIPGAYINKQVPTGTFLFNTSPTETKLTTLMRYLDMANCLVWNDGFGRLVIGKPNFTSSNPSQGKLIASYSDPKKNNLLEFRVRRNTNSAIRQIVTQLQHQEQVDPTPFTIQNSDKDVRARSRYGVGRSLYRVFSYGQGADASNKLSAVGNGKGDPKSLGEAFTLREIARENMKVLEVECAVADHLNDNGGIYDVDQIYDVQIEDEDISEPMYVYSVAYDMTIQHGLMTRLKLCRLGTICAAAAISPTVGQP